MGPIERVMKLHWASEDEGHECSRPPLGLGYNNNEVVHQHANGMWWFWDETWTDEYGPYCLKEHAENGASLYGKYLNGETEFLPLASN